MIGVVVKTRIDPGAGTDEKMMAREEILRKVHTLLAGQLHPNAHEHEAQVGAAKVQGLLLAYNLSMTDVDAATRGGKAPGVAETTVLMGCGRRDSYQWCLGLMSTVAHATNL